MQSRLCSNPFLVQITQTQGSRSRSSRSTWTTSFRAFSLGLDVHFSQVAVRQIFSKSLSATALHCKKYDNGFFFSVRLKLKEVGPMSPHMSFVDSSAILLLLFRFNFLCFFSVCIIFTCHSSSLRLERRLVTAVVGLWTMVDTVVDFFGYVVMLCLPWLLF